jgi:hypothetical protein
VASQSVTGWAGERETLRRRLGSCEGLPQVLLLASLLGLTLAAIYSSGPKKSFMMKKLPFSAAYAQLG